MTNFNLLEMAVPFEARKDKFLDEYCEYHRCRWCGTAIVEGITIRDDREWDYFCNEHCLIAWDENKAKEYGAKEADDEQAEDADD